MPGNWTMPQLVFISYTRKDAEFATALAVGLRGRQVPVWLDQTDIRPSENWNDAIDAALARADVVLVVLSENAVASREVRGEIQLALQRGKRILPVIHSKCQVPRQLLEIQSIDFTRQPLPNDDSLDQLVSAILQDHPSDARPRAIDVMASAASRNDPLGRAKKYALPGVAVAALVILFGVGANYFIGRDDHASGSVEGRTGEKPQASTLPGVRAGPTPDAVQPGAAARQQPPKPKPNPPSVAKPEVAAVTSASENSGPRPSVEKPPVEVAPVDPVARPEPGPPPPAKTLRERVSERAGTLNLVEAKDFLSDVFCLSTTGWSEQRVFQNLKSYVANAQDDELVRAESWLAKPVQGRRAYRCP